MRLKLIVTAGQHAATSQTSPEVAKHQEMASRPSPSRPSPGDLDEGYLETLSLQEIRREVANYKLSLSPNDWDPVKLGRAATVYSRKYDEDVRAGRIEVPKEKPVRFVFPL